MKKSIALLIAVCVVATTVFAACSSQTAQAEIVYMADGKVFEIQEVTSSTDAPIDDEPEKKGYEFVGWYEDEDGRRRFDFDDYFASEDKEDVVVYAKFRADDPSDDPSGDPSDDPSGDPSDDVDLVGKTFLKLSDLIYDGSGASAVRDALSEISISFTNSRVNISLNKNNYFYYSASGNELTFENAVVVYAGYEFVFESATYAAAASKLTVQGSLLDEPFSFVLSDIAGEQPDADEAIEAVTEDMSAIEMLTTGMDNYYNSSFVAARTTGALSFGKRPITKRPEDPRASISAPQQRIRSKRKRPKRAIRSPRFPWNGKTARSLTLRKSMTFSTRLSERRLPIPQEFGCTTFRNKPYLPTGR